MCFAAGHGTNNTTDDSPCVKQQAVLDAPSMSFVSLGPYSTQSSKQTLIGIFQIIMANAIFFPVSNQFFLLFKKKCYLIFEFLHLRFLTVIMVNEQL